MNQPLVTVIVPTYNRAHTLARALDSIAAQTWQALQVVVVNDHSTDGTRELLARFANSDSRFEWFDNPGPQGPSAARNAGLDAARGRYVAWLESDDEWLPGHLERAMAVLLETDADLVFADVALVRAGQAMPERTRLAKLDAARPSPIPGAPDAYLLGNTGALLDQYIACQPLTYLTTVVYDRKTLPVRFDENHLIGEDLEFYIKQIMDHDAVFAFRDATVTHKHEAGDSMSGWMQSDPSRYFGHQLDTYRALHRAYASRLPADRARALTYQTAHQARGLARAYRESGQPAKAKRYFREAFRLMPLSNPGPKLKLLVRAVAG